MLEARRFFGALAPVTASRFQRRKCDRLRSRVERILQRKDLPEPIDEEDVFLSLQSNYPPRDDYKYNPLSLWERGYQRSIFLLRLPGMASGVRKILEVGCGDGMSGSALSAFGHEVTLSDVEDWRDNKAKGISFLQADKLP